MKISDSRATMYLLLAILITAAILRFNHISQPFTDMFSWRQASTAMMAENFYRRNWNIFYPEVNWTGPGPNYQGREFQTVTYLAALLYTIVGQQDWVGRSIAVLFGLWGIFALYKLIRRVWNEEHALVSAAVMALLPGSVFVERSFLPDPAMVALVTTCVWMLVAYCQTERLRYLILASVFGILGFLTKIPGLIIGIPMLYAMLTILSRKRMLHPKKVDHHWCRWSDHTLTCHRLLPLGKTSFSVISTLSFCWFRILALGLWLTELVKRKIFLAPTGATSQWLDVD